MAAGLAQEATLSTLSGKLPSAVGPATPANSLSTVAAQSSSWGTGQKTANGTAAALASTATYKNGIILTNTDASNAVYIGNSSGVTSSTGHAILAGASIVVPVSDPAGIYVVTAGSSVVVTFAGFA